MASEIQMPSSVQPSAGVSAFALDTAPAAVSRPSKAAARLRRGAFCALAAFEGLDTAAGAVSNVNADTPAEGCALDGMWMASVMQMPAFLQRTYETHSKWILPHILRLGESNPTLAEALLLLIGVGGGTLRKPYKFRRFPEGAPTDPY